MGGPSFMVHLRSPMSAAAIELLDVRLRAEMLHVEREGSSWSFWTSADSCKAALAIAPFGAESVGGGEVTGQTMDDEDMAAIAFALGYRPAESLQFDNYCGSDRAGHRELAKFAASLAAEYEGVADLGGLDLVTHLPLATGDYRLLTGRRLLSPPTFLRWCDHEAFHLEK